jgi:uncharacterized membrane protein
MEAFVALGITLGLMAMLMFGLILVVFLMLVATVFSMVMASAVRVRATPTWQAPRVVRAVPMPRRRLGDWNRDEAAA